MSRANKRGTFASLENLEEGVDTPVEEIVVSAQPTVQDEEIDLGEAMAEVEQGEGIVEELDDGIVAVERIRIAIEEAIQDANGDPDGGMSDGMADMTDVAMANVSDDLGLGLDEEGAPEVVASSESFKAPQGRLTASLETEKGVVETLKRIWTAIKNAIIRAWEGVKTFFAKLFGGVKKLKERAAELKKKAGTIGEGKTGEITVPGAGKLSFGSSLTGANIRSGLSATLGVGQSIFGAYTDKVSAFYKAAGAESNKIAGKADGDESQIDNADLAGSVEAFDFVGKPFSGNVKFVQDWKAAGKFQEASNAVEKAGGEASKAPFKSVQALHLLTKVSAPVLSHEGGAAHKADEGSKIGALSKQEVIDILTDVEKIAGLIEGKKGAVDKLNAAAADYRKGFDAALSKIDRNMAVKSGARMYLQVLMRVGGKPWNRPVTAYSSHVFAVCRSALSLAERCIAHHGEGKEPAPAGLPAPTK